MTNVGFATLDVIPSFNGFQSRLERGTTPGLLAAGRTGGTRFGDVAGRSAGARFGSVFKTAAKATLIGVAGAGALAVKFGSDAIGSASELNESLNAVNVTYGKQARAVKKLGRESAKSLGLSNNEFNSLSVRFSAFTKTIAGGDGKKVVKTLDDLSTRASDFASVMNLDVNEAAGLFQSGLAGESEPLRRFGIDLSAASVEAFAYAHGIAEAGSKLTEAEKVQARYGSIMEQTNKTQGDFKNTSGELANQQRILSARWEDGKAKLGKGLLPIMSDAAEFLLDEGIPAFEDFSDWFNKDGIPAIKDFVTDAKPVAEKWLPKIGEGFKTAAHFGKNAAGFAGDMLDAFDKMPGWVKKILIGGVAGGLTAKKLGLGKVTGSLFSRGATPANPLFVSDISKGLGPGKPGPLSTVTKVAQAAIVAAVVAEGVKGLNQGRKDFEAGIKGSQGGHGSPFGGPQSDVVTKSWTEQYAKLNDEVKRNNRLFVTGKEVVEEFGGAIRERIPRTIHTTVTGWDVAQQDVRDYIALVLQARATHIDARLDAAGGTGPTQPRGGKGGGDGFQASGRGVTITIDKVEAQNVNTLLTDLQRRAHRASSDGIG